MNSIAQTAYRTLNWIQTPNVKAALLSLITLVVMGILALGVYALSDYDAGEPIGTAQRAISAAYMSHFADLQSPLGRRYAVGCFTMTVISLSAAFGYLFLIFRGIQRTQAIIARQEGTPADGPHQD